MLLPRWVVLFRIYIRGVDTKPDGNLKVIEIDFMYSRFESVIRSE